MKKDYQKPALYAESFVLAEHISSGCKVDSHWGSGNGPTFNENTTTCTYSLNYGDWQVFGGTLVSCGTPAFDDSWDDTDLQCYDAFQDGTGSMFAS